MEYRRFAQAIVARLDPGEEILACVREIALAEDLKLASVSALGAVRAFTVSVLKTQEGRFAANRFEGDYEIVSLTGTVNTMDDQFYCHLHLSAADERGRVVGGHLNEAIISATCEMVLTPIEGRVDRKADPKTGLNLFDFR